MALDLGELLLHIKTDTSEAESEVNGLGNKLSGGIGTAAKVVGTAITAATTAVVGFSAASVKTGMEFDTAMSQVAATMGKTTEEIQNLREYALQMGESTAFSATQCAEALNYMALAGYDADESMAMLPNVLNLAAAGNMDLARASDMVTDAQSALGLSMEQTNIMVDQMAKVSSTTNTSVEQLGDGILKIGATAQTIKGGTSELTQVLGLLADNGIKGAEGGTHLRNMILSLQTPTDKAAAALDNLGVSVYDNQGNMRELQSVFLELQGSLDGLTEQQRQEALSAIFNKTDLASVNALLGTDVERWNEVAVAIDNATGSAQKMADTQLDNLAGDMTLLKSAAEGLKITISDVLTPSLREFAQFGTDALQRLSEAFREGGLTGAMDALGTILSEGLTMVISKLPTFIDAGMQLLGALAEGIINNLPQIGQAALQIVTTIGSRLAESAPEMASGALQLIGQLCSGLGAALPQIVQIATEIVVGFVQGLTEPGAISSLISGAADLIKGLIQGLSNALPQLVEMAPQIIAALVEGIIVAIPRILECGVQIIAGLVKGIMSAIGQLPACAKAIFDGIVNAVKSLFGIASPSTVMQGLGVNIMQGLINGISSLVGSLISTVTSFCNSVKEKITETWDNIKTKTSETWDNIKQSVSEKASNIKEKVTDTWNTMKEKVTEIGNNLKEKINDTWNATKEKVSDTVNNLKDSVQDKWTAMKDKVGDLTQELKDKVSDKTTEMKDKVKDLTDELKESVHDKWSSMRDSVSDLASDLKEKATEHVTTLQSNVQEKFDTIKSDMETKWQTACDTIASTDLSDAATTIISNFASGLQSAWTSVTSWASRAVSSLKSSVSSAVSYVSNAVSGKHRVGLREVPYDGYIAELHKGEQVLTAAEANQYEKMKQLLGEDRKASTAASSTTVNFNGTYSFRDQEDINYFMNEAGKLLRRKGVA